MLQRRLRRKIQSGLDQSEKAEETGQTMGTAASRLYFKFGFDDVD